MCFDIYIYDEMDVPPMDDFWASILALFSRVVKEVVKREGSLSFLPCVVSFFYPFLSCLAVACPPPRVLPRRSPALQARPGAPTPSKLLRAACLSLVCTSRGGV